MANLALGREQTEDVVDLVLETTREHLVGFVEHKLADFVDLEGTAVDHVEHTTGRAHDAVDTRLEAAHVVGDTRATNARHALDLHVVAKRNDDLTGTHSMCWWYVSCIRTRATIHARMDV